MHWKHKGNIKYPLIRKKPQFPILVVICFPIPGDLTLQRSAESVYGIILSKLELITMATVIVYACGHYNCKIHHWLTRMIYIRVEDLIRLYHLMFVSCISEVVLHCKVVWYICNGGFGLFNDCWVSPADFGAFSANKFKVL